MWGFRKYVQSETALTQHLMLKLLLPGRQPVVSEDPKNLGLRPVPPRAPCSQLKILRKGLGWAMPIRTEHITNSRLQGTGHLNQVVLRNSDVTSFFPIVTQSPVSLMIQPHIPLPSVDICSHLCHKTPWPSKWERTWRGALDPGERGSKVLPFKLFYFDQIP